MNKGPIERKQMIEMVKATSFCDSAHKRGICTYNETGCSDCETHHAEIAISEALNRLATYEDTGLTPEEVAEKIPLVSVGDVLWAVRRTMIFTPISEWTVTMVTCKKNKKWQFRATGEYYDGTVAQADYTADEIGSVIFLTREEAEAALHAKAGDNK